MSFDDVILSSPYGYHGEECLLAFAHRLGLVARNHDLISGDSLPRSHFAGLEMLVSETTLELFAVIAPSMINDEIKFSVARISRQGHSSITLRRRTKEDDDYARISELSKKVTLSDEFVESMNNLKESKKRLAEYRSHIIKFMEATMHAFGSDTKRHDDFKVDQPEFVDDAYDILWRCVEKFPAIHPSDIEEAVSEIANALLKVNYAELSVTPSDAASALLNTVWSVFEFLADVARYCWYLGFDEWADILQTLDGRFPQTKQPSVLWTESLQESSLCQQYFSASDEGGHDHYSARLARASKWPGVWTSPALNNPSAIPALSPPFEDFSPFLDAMNSMSLSDWYFAQHCPDYHEPVLAEWDLDRFKLPDSDFTWFGGGNFWDEVTIGDPLLDDWFERIDAFRDYFRCDDWTTKHYMAFPMLGSNLFIEDLCKQDCLEFAIRRIEAEAEGESAWRRHVYQCVFRDSYGSLALAERCLSVLNQLRCESRSRTRDELLFFRLTTLVQEKLAEFVYFALRYWSGESWRKAIPDKLIETVEQRNRDPNRLEDVLKEANLLHYVNILTADATWPRFQSYLEGVGFESPSKSKVKKIFGRWNTNRNAIAHAEKRDEFEPSAIFDLEILDSWISRWSVRLMLENNTSGE